MGIHEAQSLPYVRLEKLKLELPINSSVTKPKREINRFVL